MSLALRSDDAIPAHTGFDPFRVLSGAERARQNAAHLAMMIARDGVLDPQRGALPRRDAVLAELQSRPVRWRSRKPEVSLFERFARRPSPADLDPRLVWLLAAAKANQGEEYGIELEIRRFAARDFAGVDRQFLYVAFEDHYHTRLLAELSRICGIEHAIGTPPWFHRALVRLMNHLPERMRFVPILCGEVMGAVVFQLLLDTSHVFRAEPEVEARLRWIVREVLVDEIGHISFSRARLEPDMLRVARRMLPWVARTLVRSMSELALLAGGAERVLERVCAGPVAEMETPWLAGESQANFPSASGGSR
jgi:hypothetical protein